VGNNHGISFYVIEMLAISDEGHKEYGCCHDARRMEKA